MRLYDYINEIIIIIYMYILCVYVFMYVYIGIYKHNGIMIVV